MARRFVHSYIGHTLKTGLIADIGTVRHTAQFGMANGSGAELSYGDFGTSAELSGHFGPVLVLPKGLGSEVSRV